MFSVDTTEALGRETTFFRDVTVVLKWSAFKMFSVHTKKQSRRVKSVFVEINLRFQILF